MTQDIERHEMERRVLLAALSLTVKLCHRLNIPLKELISQARVAYLRELREQGLSLAECADHLEVSQRTVKTLSKELRESFDLPDTQHTLPIQIEFMLWRTPMSRARLHQVIHNYDNDTIDQAIDQLIEEERIVLDTTPATAVYTPTQSVNSQLSTEWVKRIGGLNSLMGNLYQTIRQRFIDDDSPHTELSSFARTLSFYLSANKLNDLHELFWKTFVPGIAALDQSSHNDPDALPLKLTLFWAEEPQDDPQD